MSKRCMGCMELYDDKFDICPHCGFCEGEKAEEAIHMDPGTLLHNRYIIGRVLGVLEPEAIVDFEDVCRYEKAKKRIEERETEETED